MCKESPEHGLVLTSRPKYDAVSSRAEERTKRGRFVPDAQDIARLRPRLVGNARR